MNEIKRLILLFLRGEISAAERRELDAWLAQSPDNQLLFEEISDPEWVATGLGKMDALHEEEIWKRIEAQTANGRVETLYPPAVGRITRKIRGYWAAAGIVVLFVAGVIIWRAVNTSKQAAVAQQPVKNDVLPGGNKAILTLSNGQQIVLDSAHNGALAQQGNSQIVKTDSGQIAYNTMNERPTAMLYNTLTTPRGGQHQLTLADGTKVWLNAASSIRYPVAFIGSERKVEVTGEAYFEVTKDAARPFKVEINAGQELDVLGTSFDVNTYSDEPKSKATLLAGSINVQTKVLKPGEQAEWTGDQPAKISSNADVEEAVAWKNGKFIFSGDDIQSVMRQLERWYDVDVKYEGDFKGVEPVGVVSRFKNISEILGMLEQTRTVSFKVEGRKVTVLPYKK